MYLMQISECTPMKSMKMFSQDGEWMQNVILKRKRSNVVQMAINNYLYCIISHKHTHTLNPNLLSMIKKKDNFILLFSKNALNSLIIKKCQISAYISALAIYLS